MVLQCISAYIVLYCFLLFCTVLFYTGSPKCLPLGNLSLLAKISVIRLHTLGSTLARHHANLSNWIKRQARLAGKSMSHRFALTELRGDWKWHREFWLMKRHYKAKDVCHCCFASIYSGPTQYLMSALICFFFNFLFAT